MCIWINILVTKNNLQTQCFGLSIINWNLEKSGIQDINIIGIYSLTILHNRKAQILFFIRPFFYCRWTLYLHSPFQLSIKSNVFKGWLALLGQRCMLILQELAVNLALVFDPVAQLFVFPSFHILSSSMSMLEMNNILRLFIPNFLWWSCFFGGAFPSLSFVLSDFVILPPCFCSDLS